MTERAARGTWVEIHRIVLPAGERVSQVPEDTQRMPLEMRVNGFLTGSAASGEEVEIETPAGRRVRGKLIDVKPSYTHGFGAPIAELDTIGREVQAILRERGAFK